MLALPLHRHLHLRSVLVYWVRIWEGDGRDGIVRAKRKRRMPSFQERIEDRVVEIGVVIVWREILVYSLDGGVH